jgi:hypothetical protein
MPFGQEPTLFTLARNEADRVRPKAPQDILAHLHFW